MNISDSNSKNNNVIKFNNKNVFVIIDDQNNIWFREVVSLIC